MAKTPSENKAMNVAPETKANMANRDTFIEGRDAGPGEAEYNYPLQHITVVAKSQEDADAKMHEIVKGRDQVNADEAENN